MSAETEPPCQSSVFSPWRSLEWLYLGASTCNPSAKNWLQVGYERGSFKGLFGFF